MKSESAIRRQIRRARKMVDSAGPASHNHDACFAYGVETALRWVVLKGVDWVPIDHVEERNGRIGRHK